MFLKLELLLDLVHFQFHLALPDDGKLIALDKNEETNKIALSFFKKANQDHKIQTIIKPALKV